MHILLNIRKAGYHCVSCFFTFLTLPFPTFPPDCHAPSRPFAEFLSASEIIEATPALLNDQRRRFVSSPDIVLQPNSVESVQKIMRFCFENRIRVTPQGGNTGLCGATVTAEGVLLNLSKLNRIRDINLADNRHDG